GSRSRLAGHELNERRDARQAIVVTEHGTEAPHGLARRLVVEKTQVGHPVAPELARELGRGQAAERAQIGGGPAVEAEVRATRRLRQEREPIELLGPRGPGAW